MQPQYEYKCVPVRHDCPLGEHLDPLARDGWRLVQTLSGADGLDGGFNWRAGASLIFERPASMPVQFRAWGRRWSSVLSGWRRKVADVPVSD